MVLFTPMPRGRAGARRVQEVRQQLAAAREERRLAGESTVEDVLFALDELRSQVEKLQESIDRINA